MKAKKLFILLIAANLTQTGLAQNTENDKEYYKNWIGLWYKQIDNKTAYSPSFVVQQGLYKGSFEEVWMGAGGDFSKAWRAWDQRTKKWGFAWMSSDGLFQTWQGKKVNGIWYIYKTFTLNNGESVLSRQAFIPKGSATIIRTSEHSRDNGKTWVLRFKEKYVKKK